MRRIGSLLAAMGLLALLLVCPCAAASSTNLLLQDQTTLNSSQGAFSYTETGALHLTAPDSNGSSVAIEFNKTININAMRYIHLSVSSTSPFNVALKVGSNSYDVYPQITGPSWYEQFQATAPGLNEGVAAGSYTVVLDLKNYIEYNQLEVGADGYVFVRSIHIFIKGMGEMTVHHLASSDMVAFAANGVGATAAPTKAPIITAPHGATAPGDQALASYTTTTVLPEMHASPNQQSGTVAIIMALAVLLVGALVGLSVMNNYKKQQEKQRQQEREERRKPK